MKTTNEEVLKEILEQTLAGYWDWDIPSGVEYYSPAFKKMFGYEENEIENKPDSWKKLIFEDDLPLVIDMYNLHVKSKGRVPYRIEVRYHHKDGATVWVMCTGRVVEWDSYEKPKRMVGCHIDISERKKHEKNLHDTNELLSLFIKHSPIYAYIKEVTSGQSKVIKASENFMEMIGVPGSQMKGKTMEELFPPEFAKKITSDDIKVVEEGIVVKLDENLGERNYSTIKYPITQGEKTLLAGYTFDITEQKNSENALKESEEKLRLFIEHAPVVIAMFDQKMQFIAASQRWMTYFDLQGINIIGRSHYEVFPVLPDHLKDAHKRGLNGENIKSDDETFESPEGSVQYVSWEILPWKTASGAVGGIIVFIEDNTERRRAEETLNNMQKLESLGILAGGIAHDFNNLLGGIFGFIDIAAMQTKDSNITRYLAQALNIIDRARGLTGQLLTFAKGGTPIKKLEALNPFIVDTVKFALSGSNVSSCYTIPENLWLCEFDKNQIGRVIDNIVINAQQSMPDGGMIEISAQNNTISENIHSKLKKGYYVSISIKDNGIGIPKNILSRIFDPFYTTKTKGHGLGLATCFSIMQRHGGCIDVESEPGKGSTFTIFLPANPESDSIENANKLVGHCGNGTFIVMDDEEMLRETIGLMLDTFGYTVIQAESGWDVITQLQKEKESIVGMILDLTIPGGMGGKDAIAEIKKSAPEIPVFVMSGYSEDPVMAQPALYGFTASICKPFVIAQLSDLLERNLKK
jgi:PAS domain S-box-containing protein